MCSLEIKQRETLELSLKCHYAIVNIYFFVQNRLKFLQPIELGESNIPELKFVTRIYPFNWTNKKWMRN